jgi:peptidase M1-like protein
VFGRIVAAAGAIGLLALAQTGAEPQPAPQTVASSPATPAAQNAPRSPRNASYTITARLDPASRMLNGEELLTWRNTSANPTSHLRFHLYYNAWRNTRSTYVREEILAGNTEIAERPESDWSWIDVTSVKLIRQNGAPVDVTSNLRYVAPDDGNADDRTVAEIPLTAPVAPGQTINVQITWSSRVPRTFARTGAIGNYYFLAQWFPKIGVLQDDGWNCHQFHAGTEFFADFGIYDVRLTVPTGWIVGATGAERSRRDEGNRTTTHNYYAEDVHDFAWTTSPDYVEQTERFEHATLPPVTLRLLLQPEHVGQERRHFDAARATLKYYGEWFGPYPYGNLTIVDPAWQSGADGMEYPTLITAGTRWLAPRSVSEPEDVTVHEGGHQFWYGIVATNEFEHAWMDEGLNTFSTARVIDQYFGADHYEKRYFGGFIPWAFNDLPLSRAIDGNRLAGYRRNARTDILSTPSWRYWPSTGGAITYNKTAVWLNTLERMLGWDTLQKILSTYFSRYAFKHPTPADFFAVATEVSGRDLTPFFDQVYRSTAVVDYSVELLTSDQTSDRGYFGDSGKLAYAVDQRSSASTGAGEPYRTTVVVRRLGDAMMPVDVRVVFENGKDTRWSWDGRDAWKMFQVDGPVRAVSAQVDPDRVLLLDVNYTNNSRSLAPKAAAAARKWSLTWLIWLQDHLLTHGFFI